MKKTIAILILISMLVLSSCEYLPFLSGDKNEGQNQNTENQGETQQDTENEGETQEKMYYAVKTLYSYEDVMDALEIVRKKHNTRLSYTVKDMGEDYTVFYQFVTPNCLTSYPIDYETYFTTKTFGTFETVIFLENTPCTKHTPSRHIATNLLKAYKGDEDYEMIFKYVTEYASVWLKDTSKILIDVTDKSKLTYASCALENRFEYYIFYDDNNILDLWSCVELDEAFFEVFFNSIVIA